MSNETVQEIGRLYRSAQQSSRASLAALMACGRELIQAKESIPHGEWLLWLKNHQETLGFTDRTARRLILLARNWTLTSDLTDSEVAGFHRLVWGNEDKDSPVQHRKSPFEAFLAWVDKTEAREFVIDDPVILLARIERLRHWLDELESIYSVRRVA